MEQNDVERSEQASNVDDMLDAMSVIDPPANANTFPLLCARR